MQALCRGHDHAFCQFWDITVAASVVMRRRCAAITQVPDCAVLFQL
jgi:hypothetical protein